MLSASSSSFVDTPVDPEAVATIMDFEVRFVSNESELQETQNAVKQLTLQLDHFLKNFGTNVLTANPLNSPPLSPQLPMSAITPSAPISCFKLATPSDFNGDQKKGCTF